MTHLLIVHHTPSPATAELLDSVVSGAQDPEIDGVEVVCRAALAATASDLLAADGIILGTTRSSTSAQPIPGACLTVPTSTATSALKAPSARSVRSPTHSAGSQ